MLADSGEDAIAFSTGSDYAANVEKAEAVMPEGSRASATADRQLIDTPNQHSIEDVSQFLAIPATQCLKTLIVKGEDEGLVALLLRGDHELNKIKAEKMAGVASPLEFASEDDIQRACNCKPGSIGPLGLTIPVIADIRTVVEGDPSPDGQGEITLARGIEVGHIFQLGTKYSTAMKAGVINEGGKNQIMLMGCYGIGISRVVAAAIEQNHDEKGIIWPASLAPFQVALCPMNMHKSERLKAASGQLYQDLLAAGIDVLFDDRKVRAGFMFSDMELIGIPHCIIVGDRGLDTGTVEYKARTAQENEEISFANIIDFLKEKLI